MAIDNAITTTSGLAQKAAQTGQQAVSLAKDFQQFSQVEQQINSNQKLDSLLALQLSSISSVALGYVGMDISYVSAEMNYDGSTPVDINYALSSEAVTCKVHIYDEEGELVYSGDAPRDTGTNKVTWDGKDTNGNNVEQGTYTVAIDALDINGEPIDNSTVVTGRVRGIETQNGVVYVLVGDRAVSISNIVNATLPAETAGTVPETDNEDNA